MSHSTPSDLAHRLGALAAVLGLVGILVGALPLAARATEARPTEAVEDPVEDIAPVLPERPLQAAFLVVDGVYNSELMAPYDILQHTIFHVEPGIEVFTVSPDGEPVTTFEGLVLDPHHSFETAPAADILVVPSAEHSMGSDLENRAMIDWVAEAGREARWVMSLCDGAFVLAEAGLLDDRSATTFPADYDAFAARFPDVDLRINVSFVHDGPALTSQGGARSYDVALYLVDLLYGERVAHGVGAGLLIPWPQSPEAMPRLVVATATAADDEPSAPVVTER